MKNARYWFYWYFWNHVTNFYYDTNRMIRNHISFHKAIKSQFLDEADGLYDMLYWKLKHLYKCHKEWDDHLWMAYGSGSVDEIFRDYLFEKESEEESERMAYWKVQHRKSMAAMKLSLKIASRLHYDWYEKVTDDMVDKGVGGMALVEAMDKFHAVKKRDRKLLFQLVDEWMEGWWH